jgi:SPP1 family phage portal protein
MQKPEERKSEREAEGIMLRNLFDMTTEKATEIIKQGAKTQLTDTQFLEMEIAKWKESPERRLQLAGFCYYKGDHDILERKRTMIGEDGKLQIVENLPNNRIVDNQFAKMVTQKANYILGKPFILECKNETYLELLKKQFNRKFMRTMKNACKSSLKSGIAWLYPYYDTTGGLVFRILPAYEILPFWKDTDHMELDFAVRVYQVEAYEGRDPVLIEKVEIYSLAGIRRYVLVNDALIPDVEAGEEGPHITKAGEGKEGLNWQKVPLIAIKYNEAEIPLIKKVKSLQDGINTILSDFENNMQEDARNTILVIKNYDGQNLGEFRRNLAAFGAIKVRNEGGGAAGDVTTLTITVNAENYKAVLELFKKALIENAMGYDAKDDRLSGNPNQMNIKSMYSDIDLDANDMETELQAAFEEILWFIRVHLASIGAGSFPEEEVNIIFNRDMLINESEVINDCKNSVGILSDETIIAQHPWTKNVKEEMERIRKQQEEAGKEEEEYEIVYGRQSGEGGQAAENGEKKEVE